MIRYGKKDIVKQLREKMEAAAERLDFETAALLRDQIAAIDRVAPGQKVVRGAEEDMDVLAFAGTTKAVCAAILRYRGGRLSDKREFLFHDTADIPALRAAALYKQDEGMSIRRSHENPVIQAVYQDYLGEPGGHKAPELLHCTYVPQERYRTENKF